MLMPPFQYSFYIFRLRKIVFGAVLDLMLVVASDYAFEGATPTRQRTKATLAKF